MERRATEPDRRTYDIPGETGEDAELTLLRSVGLADPAAQPIGPIPDDDDGVNDRPEALEEHEVPGYRAEDDLDWPIITSDPRWLLEHGGSRETRRAGVRRTIGWSGRNGRMASSSRAPTTSKSCHAASGPSPPLKRTV